MNIEGNVAEQTTLEKLIGKIVAIPQVDDTLTKANYGADAKVTGDKFKELEGIFKDYTKPDARKVEYDNEESKLDAEDIQSAIDEVVAKAKADLEKIALTYLKLTGGELHGSLKIKHFDNGFSTIDKNHSETADYGTFVGDVSADGKSAKVSVSALLNLLTFTDANGEIRDVFHEGNKLYGSYEGNGDATSQVITDKGIGRLALMYCSTHLSLVTPKGALVVDLSTGNISWVDSAKVFIGDNKLTVSTNNSAFNSLGVTYHYQVI